MRLILRRLAIAAVAIIFVLIAAVLSYGNQDPIPIDLGFVRLESVSVTVALAMSFALGAVFGGLLAALTMLRHFAERRVLRRELRRAESELANIRSLPLHDAD